MTQLQFDMILKTIELGAPVFYSDLGNALNNLVTERNALEQENKALKEKLTALEGNNN